VKFSFRVYGSSSYYSIILEKQEKSASYMVKSMKRCIFLNSRNKLDEKTSPSDLKNVSDSLETDVDMVKSNNHNNNNISELHIQLKQLRIELERKDSELR
jgi:hypothetical protein